MFHFFLFLLQFFSSVSYSFQCTGLNTSLVQFILICFILFDAGVDGIVLISLSDNSFLVNRHTTDYNTLILYPVTLLNVLISSNSYFGEVSGF